AHGEKNHGCGNASHGCALFLDLPPSPTAMPCCQPLWPRACTGALIGGGDSTAAINHCDGAPVLRPARNVVANGHGAFFAVGDCANTRRADALRDEEVFRCFRAARSERDVVFARAALVGVPLD